MTRSVGSVGLSAICGSIAMPLVIAGALGLLGVALASPAPPQVPLLTNLDVSAPESYSQISVMVVGDSITQGTEGDWTWRYRLWEWFRDQKVKVCDENYVDFEDVIDMRNDGYLSVQTVLTAILG